REDGGDELGKLGVDGRLAAADRHRRRAAVVQRLQAGGDRQAVLELAGVALGGAAQAVEVAGVERLEHEDEGVAAVAGPGVLRLVADHVGGDVEGKSHGTAPSWRTDGGASPAIGESGASASAPAMAISNGQ